LIDDATTTEDASWDFFADVAGTEALQFSVGAGVIVGTGTTFGGAGTATLGSHLLFGADATSDIGTSTVGVNDLHFGSGGIINLDGGDVTLTHAANQLQFSGGDFVINDGFGAVIGSLTQQTFYDEQGTAFTPEFQVVGTAGDSIMSMGRWNAGTGAPKMTFFKSRGAAIGDHALVVDGDDVGMYAFAASDGVDGEPVAAILAEVDGTAAENDMPGRISFATTLDGTAAITTRMTIKNDGGVIIGSGTTSPGNDGDIRQYSADDSATGPTHQQHHDDPSADAGDDAGRWEIFGGADDEEIGSIFLDILDPGTGSEDTDWAFVVRVAGADLTLVNMGVVDTAEYSFVGNSALNLDDNNNLRLFETEANGDNFKAFDSADANTADTTCTFENDANFIPDSCVGDGSDASDARLKKILNPANPIQVGALLDQIRIYDFEWTATSEKSEKVKKGDQGFGPMAQELFQVNSDWVEVGGEDPITQPWTWKPEAIVPYLIVEIQNLRKRVHELEQGVH
jgi:hypothetical protein